MRWAITHNGPPNLCSLNLKRKVPFSPMTLLPQRLDRTGFISRSALVLGLLFVLSLAVQTFAKAVSDPVTTALCLIVFIPLYFLAKARLSDFAPKFPLLSTLVGCAIIYGVISFSGLVPLGFISWLTLILGAVANIIVFGGFIALCVTPAKTSHIH